MNDITRSITLDNLRRAEQAMKELGVAPPDPTVVDRVVQLAEGLACAAQLEPAMLAIENGLLLAAQAVAIGNRGWLRTMGLPWKTLAPAGAVRAIGVRFNKAGTLACWEELLFAYGRVFVNDGRRETWWPNGEPYLLQHFVNGAKHGTFTYWSENGFLLEEITYDMTVQVGQSMTYRHTDGSLARIENRNSKGQLDGWQLFFYPNGFLSSANWYEENSLDKMHVFLSFPPEQGRHCGFPHGEVIEIWERQAEETGVK